MRGVAYVGALEVLEEKGVLSGIRRVAGTSAGAIVALLVGLKYSNREIDGIMSRLDFNRFLDPDGFCLSNVARVLRRFGWYRGDFFRAWAGEIVKARMGRSDATFADARSAGGEFREMYFISTNLSTGYGEVFSNEYSPEMPLADAVRRSMSIPLFFVAPRSERGDVYVDGGVFDNYPIKLFDRERYIETYSRPAPYYEAHNAELARAGLDISRYVYNKESLGFRLDTQTEIGVFRDHREPVKHEISRFKDYMTSLVGAVMAAEGSRHLHSDDWQRTIYVDTLDVKTTEFDLGDDRKAALIRSGRDSAQTYFKWYDNAPGSEQVFNRP